MKISLQNIAKVKTADIEIDGIAVIAGPNNTGKSTVGKALFSVFNSLYLINKNIYNLRVFEIAKIFRDMVCFDERNEENFDFLEYLNEEIQELSAHIVTSFENKNETNIREKVFNLIKGSKNIYKEENKIFYEPYIKKISDVLDLQQKFIFSKVVSSRITKEFEGQVSNIYNDRTGYINLVIKNKIVKICIENNDIHSVDTFVNTKTEAIYIDDNSIVDEYRMGYSPRMFNLEYFYMKSDNHKIHLRKKFFSRFHENNIINEIMTEKELSSIYKIFDNVYNWKIEKQKGTYFYKDTYSEKLIKLKNLSSGLKTFVVLKQLLLNGSLEKNGTLILDEPEIHLHPEWQLIFAEIIVLLQKAFGLHILLNTHSPYFLRAIQVYAAKHEIADKCKYYLSRLEGNDAYIDDVTKNTEKIFSSLAKPFQELEDEIWDNS